jgi:hypothetical protein
VPYVIVVGGGVRREALGALARAATARLTAQLAPEPRSISSVSGSWIPG